LLLLKGSSRSCAAMLSNISFRVPSVRSRCQSLRSYLFSSIFYLFSIEQLYALRVSVCSGVAFEPAHSIVLLKNFAALISSSVLREKLKNYCTVAFICCSGNVFSRCLAMGEVYPLQILWLGMIE
jgi:hypothetical protein